MNTVSLSLSTPSASGFEVQTQGWRWERFIPSLVVFPSVVYPCQHSYQESLQYEEVAIHHCSAGWNVKSVILNYSGGIPPAALACQWDNTFCNFSHQDLEAVVTQKVHSRTRTRTWLSTFCNLRLALKLFFCVFYQHDFCFPTTPIPLPRAKDEPMAFLVGHQGWPQAVEL